MNKPLFFQHIMDSPRFKSLLGCALLMLSLCWLGYGVLQQARVVEDAYISFRVVDNAITGHGLRWNADERVQVYTNPLWTLLHIPFYALWRHIEQVTLGLSALCVAGGLWLMMCSAGGSLFAVACLIILPFAASYSFTSYATSGLENPMSFFLFCWFGWALMKAPPQQFWLHVGLASALSVVNRMDTALLYLPAMLFLLTTRYPAIRWRQLFLAAVPVVGWFAFSIIYYGFIFPNTKYAKLTTSMPQSEFILQGMRYFANLVVTDVVMAAALMAAIISGALLTRDYWRTSHERSGVLAAVAMGVLLYVVYVVYVGGNQRSGRFWSLPVAASVWLLYVLWAGRISTRYAAVIGTAALCIAVAYPSHGWLKEQVPFAFDGMFLGNDDGQRIMDKNYKPVVARSNPRGGVISAFEVGKLGFSIGPDVHIIDRFGLGDPLLARMKSHREHLNVVGHFPRHLPKGYYYAVETGALDKMDKGLAAYYRALRVITRDDIWDRKRLKTLMEFQQGRFDRLVP